MWDPSSLTRDQTLCFGRQSLNHWTTREDPTHHFLNNSIDIYSHPMQFTYLKGTIVLECFSHFNKKLYTH